MRKNLGSELRSQGTREKNLDSELRSLGKFQGKKACHTRCPSGEIQSTPARVTLQRGCTRFLLFRLPKRAEYVASLIPEVQVFSSVCIRLRSLIVFSQLFFFVSRNVFRARRRGSDASLEADVTLVSMRGAIVG